MGRCLGRSENVGIGKRALVGFTARLSSGSRIIFLAREAPFTRRSSRHVLRWHLLRKGGVCVDMWSGSLMLVDTEVRRTGYVKNRSVLIVLEIPTLNREREEVWLEMWRRAR